MQNETTTNPPPDWAAREKDLLCPLCSYNLRGLTESRCPECGFKFTWQELLDAEKTRHLYLFEYGKGRNISTFWKTYWRTCRPRRFWRDVNPAQEVRWVRLILYWILACSVIAALIAAPYAKPIWQVGYQTFTQRAAFKPVPGMPGYLTNGISTSNPFSSRFTGPVFMTGADLDYQFPLPWHLKFWEQVQQMAAPSYYPSYWGCPDLLETPTMGWSVIFLAWPFLTLISLMIFRFSMRQAKIRASHLVRSVVYSCDFGFLIVIAAVAGSFVDSVPNQGIDLVTIATFCAAITTYRLTIAFRQYLRVHLPLATVLASQLIAFLIVFIVLVQIADFSRRI